MQIFFGIDLLIEDTKRFNKQILELGQIISTSFFVKNDILKVSKDIELYKPCYINHPIVKWAYSSQNNLLFCINYMFSLDKIKQDLFNKKQHGTCLYLSELKQFFSHFINSKDALLNYLLSNKINIPLVFKIENIDVKQINEKTKDFNFANLLTRFELHRNLLHLKRFGRILEIASM